MLKKYKTIIFDLGGVLINLDFERSIKEFKKDLPQFEPDLFCGKEDPLPLYLDFEVGKTKTSEFISAFNSYHQSNISEKRFIESWNMMILDFPLERIQLLQKLRKLGKKLILLSNTNEIHEEAVNVRFNELNLGVSFWSLFDKVYCSHHLGLRKPSLEIYDRLIKENSLNPVQALFIDDSAANIQAAKKTGLESLQLISPMTLIELDVFSS